MCSRRGKGESEAPGGGGDQFFIESPRRRGGSPGRDRPRGREGVSGESGNSGRWGGRLNIFFGAENVHQDLALFDKNGVLLEFIQSKKRVSD